MSFHTVRIIKQFPSKNNRKIMFKKKKCLKKKNITIKIEKKQILPNNQINKYNYHDFSSFNISLDQMNNNHYIGLLIVNSISVNKLHKLKWDKIESIYLNITRILLYKNDKFPIIEIPDNEYQPGFKFKKFIKKYITSSWLISKKNIQGIKLLGNYGNLHIYTVIMNNPHFVHSKKFLKGGGQNYSWRNIFDQYDIEKKELNQDDMDQGNIYKKIIINRNTSLVKYNFNLKPNLDNIYDKYLVKYLLDYEYILHQLSSFSFK
jgi:hypothetical protein